MRRITRFLLLPLVALLTLSAGSAAEALGPVPAQGRAAAPVLKLDVPSQQAAMDRLSFMVGRWLGTGWVLTGSGTRQEFIESETVRRVVSGTVLSVEGEGRDKADPRRVVHSALAVVNFNDSTQQYRWEAFSQGYVSVVTPEVGTNRFVWSLQTPSSTVRYTLTFTATTWHE